MKIIVKSYSQYCLTFALEKYLYPSLIGSQTIYSEEIQNILIETFNNDSGMEKFIFFVNKVLLHPTISSNYTDKNIIYVSNEIFEEFFKNICEHTLKFMYNISKVHHILLKREAGNFPRDDSLERSLIKYFESCMTINKDQFFVLNYHKDDFIKFRITQIKLVNTPTKTMEDRLQEIDLSVKINTLFEGKQKEVGLSECESLIHNFAWYHNTIAKQKVFGGDVSYQQVEVSFEEQEVSKVTIPEQRLENPIPEQPVLNAQQMREKRLEFYNKKN